MKRKLLIAGILGLILFTFGCSGGAGVVPTSPDNTGKDIKERVSNTKNHLILGLYQFKADPDRQTLDVAQLRTPEFHLNALPFLEPPPLLNLTLESLQFNGDIIDAVIGLRHPFLGLTEFTGFDVSGIFITNGSLGGFGDAKLCYAGLGDTRLLNPDGYSRWWNPYEFPYNPTGKIGGYVDGLLGTPDAAGNYNCTLNAYKYFCDDLDDPDDPMSNVTQAKRGMFSAGSKNVRHYTLELGAGLIFNYAVDACWQFPQGGKPWQAPDDFGPAANRIEPWYISVVETENTLYYEDGKTGGELGLSIKAYDWFNAGQDVVYVESANGVVPKVGPISPTGGGEGYSTYQVDITETDLTAPGDLDLLVTVETEENDFQGFINGTKTSAYLVYKTHISDTAPTIPEDPVIIDENGCFGTAMAIDENKVIHTSYADTANLYWSYSTNKGSIWVNFGSIYQPAGDLVISATTISMWEGPSDGYVYVCWAEWSSTSVHRALWAGRMPVDLSGNFEPVKVWEHFDGYPEQHFDSTQIVALDDGEFLIYSMFYYQLGGGFRAEFTRVDGFPTLEGAPELEVNNYFTGGGSLLWNYTGTTREMDYDSSRNVYFINSGYFFAPSWCLGSFILKNSVGAGTWSYFDVFVPGGDPYNVWYWDNRSNGLFVDDSDMIHCVSEWQNGNSYYGGDDHGYYSLIYGEGTTGGPLTWTDPIPNMKRGNDPPGYPNARYDYEWIATSCVEDGNGLTYITFQDCVNKPDAYYITYDGTDWHHNASESDWVKINTTAGQKAYHPYAIRGLDGYVYVTYADTDGSAAGVPVFKAVKEE